MPLKASKIRIKSKKVIIKNPKGFFLDDPDTDVIALRKKSGKTLVGVTFTKILPPRPPKRLRVKKKPGRKRKRGKR